jgi:hypothetical protein
MCISAATMLAISAGVSAGGQLLAGRAQMKAGEAQAKQAAIASAQERDVAEQEAARIRKAGDRQRGAARAQLAASGVAVNEGSSLTIEDEISQGAEMDAMNTLLTGKRRSDAQQASGRQALKAGRNAMISSVLGATSTALQGWKGVSSNQAGSVRTVKSVPIYDGAEY